ncbi:MAG: aspartate-semialdehyde dehydrogenase [Henriciella sp.]|uniref:aspartate-semialdehyde dehydrogenase n=1 Tax=Henriciella sp. TaxID=1968823 RepID=UPI00261A783A|nr:aspartate-semialdehyde dehydrogenase [Henriciella sp.]
MQHDDFRDQLSGGRLLTAEIIYYRPDFPKLLQSFVWQTIDRAPKFPRLAEFLDHWRREIEAVIHSINISHADMLRPAQVRWVDEEMKIQKLN